MGTPRVRRAGPPRSPIRDNRGYGPGDGIRGRDCYRCNNRRRKRRWTAIEWYEERARARLPELAPGSDPDAFSLAYNLLQLAQLLVNDLEATVHRPRGWSLPGFRLMFKLWVLGPTMPARLADLSQMSRSAVTNAVHTLERAGLVERLPAPHDRRAQTVALTGRGRAAMREALARHTAREAQWFAGLDDARRAELTGLLRDVLGHRPPPGVGE